MTAAEAVKAMHKGINFGNSWDGAPNGATDFLEMKNIIDTTWNYGFRSCRFTVTWSQGISPQPSGAAGGNLDNLKQAVKYALDKGYFVLLNWHWNHPDPGNTDGFEQGWKVIAGSDQYFSRKAFPSNKLMFEVLNEPNYGNDDSCRKVNQVGYNAIRSVDKTRIVFLMPDSQGNWGSLFSVYPNAAMLPGQGKDVFLGVDVHSYDPWPFAGENNGGYPGCNFYQDMATKLANWRDQQTHVPVTMTEYGLNDMPRESQNDHCYMSLMSNLLRNKEIAPIVWNDYGGFGIIGKNGQFSNGAGQVVLDACQTSCGCCNGNPYNKTNHYNKTVQ